MYALPCSDNLTDVPEINHADRVASRNRGGRMAPSRSMLRASYAELHRLAADLVRQRRSGRAIDPRTLVNEAARHTLGASGLQDLAEPAGYLAFLANALHGMLDELVEECIAQHCEAPLVWLNLPGVAGGADLVGLLAALRRLEQRSGRHAQIAVLRMFGGLSDAEIAAELAISETRARVGWSRVRDWMIITCSAPRR